MKPKPIGVVFVLILVAATAPTLAQPPPTQGGSVSEPVTVEKQRQEEQRAQNVLERGRQSGSAEEQRLTLADCLRIALENRPALKAAQAQVAVARAGVRAQESRWMPSLTGTWAWSKTRTVPRVIRLPGGVVGTGSGTVISREASVGLNLTLFQTGLREGIKAAKEAEKASAYELEDVRRALLQQVAELYYTCLADRRLVEVRAEGVRTALRHLEMVDSRIEAGAAARSDRLPVEVELAQARLLAVQAESALRRDLANLRAALGLKTSDIPRLAEALAIPEFEPDVEELARQALQTRADLKAQRHSLESLRWNLRQAKLNARLNLSLGVQGEYGRYSQGAEGRSWWMGVSATVPVFSGQARAEVDRARAQLRRAEENLAELELQVLQELEQAYLALVEARARIEEADKSMQAARQNLQIAEERYRVGVGNIIEVTDAEQSLREAEAAYVQAVYDYNIARVRVLSASGADLQQSLGGGQ